MADLRIQSLAKTFKDGRAALSGISFDVADREAVFLLGPSGAGKTTTLRLVAGLEDATGGRIVIGGRDVTELTPRERNLAMVYDKHSLFPHLSIFENLAYPLRIRKMSEGAMKARIAEVAETLQIGALMDRLPAQLSGGQQQRVAIGRALVREAACYLLDEPISHLDAQLRAKMRVEFKRLQRDFQATMLYVSHDQLEAMTMADRIVLINNGLIEQIAAPQDLFDRPATQFAATFIGEPVMNTLPVRLGEEAGETFLTLGTTRVPVDVAWLARGEELPVELTLGIRPQQIALSPPGEEVPGRVEGAVFAVETLGSRVIFDIEAGQSIVRVMTTVDAARQYPEEIGAAIAFRVHPDFIYLFDPVSGRTLRQAQFTERPPV
jgi:ABC-type sugar transport system ATPase subunit